MTKYDGGYYVIREPLIRKGRFAHTAADMSGLSDLTINSLNTVQATPWTINRDVWAVFGRAFADNDPLGGALCVLPPSRPERLLEPEAWDTMSDEAKADWRRETKQAFETFDAGRSEYDVNQRLFSIAGQMEKYERIWFPFSMDFRTRFYPIPTTLHPQGNDLVKGLLTFADGYTVGASGLWWLYYAFASSMGHDKLPGRDRVSWTIQNEAIIKQLVTDPRAVPEWVQTKERFQALALAFEIDRAWCLDNPESFVSHLPVCLDGSCNGAQHLSLMSRDKIGAEATNCRAIPYRNDLYRDVADRVMTALKETEDTSLVRELRERMDSPARRREMVKRSVMTVPYGVTEYGVKSFMYDDGHVKGLSEPFEAAKLLTKLIMASIDGTLAKGRELQGYFASVARELAKDNIPLSWDTPAGSRVIQAYYELKERRIQTLHGRISIHENDPNARLRPLKNAASAPPNVVHSCDAAHMQMVVSRLQAQGVRHFQVIHDSFGVHASNVSLMKDVIRETAYDIYKDDYIHAWRDSVIRYSGRDIPNPPSLGDFDVAEVLNAEWFFS